MAQQLDSHGSSNICCFNQGVVFIVRSDSPCPAYVGTGTKILLNILRCNIPRRGHLALLLSSPRNRKQCLYVFSFAFLSNRFPQFSVTTVPLTVLLTASNTDLVNLRTLLGKFFHAFKFIISILQVLSVNRLSYSR